MSQLCHNYAKQHKSIKIKWSISFPRFESKRNSVFCLFIQFLYLYTLKTWKIMNKLTEPSPQLIRTVCRIISCLTNLLNGPLNFLPFIGNYAIRLSLPKWYNFRFYLDRNNDDKNEHFFILYWHKLLIYGFLCLASLNDLLTIVAFRWPSIIRINPHSQGARVLL